MGAEWGDCIVPMIDLPGKARGTAPIARVTVIRNNQAVFSAFSRPRTPASSTRIGMRRQGKIPASTTCASSSRTASSPGPPPCGLAAVRFVDLLGGPVGRRLPFRLFQPALVDHPVLLAVPLFGSENAEELPG